MGKYDDAHEFIHKFDSSEKQDEINIASVYRKIDMRILPLLSGIYFLQFLDKALINYAGVMGIKDHLDNPAQFSDLATILYAGYIICEPFVAFGFQKLPFAKFFGVSIVLWGVVVTLHSACLNYSSLMAIRFLLGCVEATAASGVLVCNGMWYSHKQQLSRFGIITSQVGSATVVGGLLSFGFQHVVNGSLESWQILFLVMGLITVVFGVMVLVILPDNPMNCKFLTDQEKLALLDHLKDNQTGIENKTFKWAHVKSYLKDKQSWLIHILTIISMIPTGAINTFSVTIIGTFGFDSKKSALMQMPVGVSSILAILIPMYSLYYLKGNYRTAMFVGLLLIAIAGYFILIYCTNTYANLFAVYFGNAGTCVITLIYSWNNRNTAGYTKRLIRNCGTMICIAIGGLIGPQLFKTDAPRYLPAKIALLVISFVSIPLVVLLGFVSRWENQKRDNISEKDSSDFHDHYGDDFEYKDLTDVENIHFRYGY
ncbi:hypothetical protein PSN45_002950 [Yamadazyma tenuis]|uniref:MFS general substrate transporter n=1 Tax=Candida tenuis (strain ATCC 10573 / BCRC 21748 / CBS 615 / JCM 9827 / NBRC 10315 / NRRL Y-1498 / VKM Y-70) TaxID=590646 RepID=G3AW46_CANTC|nr:MFS general substrate transporter [Yamadazyma tenuis ATCC 10573]EGV66450.1 MFS general substrate transporter [Yamadazyma tenuis ATCC 10573]WEJ95431.1 hypothetical protein PSN45_002950 [Yamadazyma tenuis]